MKFMEDLEEFGGVRGTYKGGSFYRNNNNIIFNFQSRDLPKVVMCLSTKSESRKYGEAET